MNSSRSSRRAGAFTLVELLCVIAIIGILVALLLPALNQSQLRVKRIDCESHLHQLGIAFQIFGHDHNDKFPMAVPMAEGGSQEFVQNGYAVGREFYFSFRHFQVLSNELGRPAILICPTDTRLPATDFGALQNSNVSYFVGVKANFSKPDSILAGDRNLTANALPNPSIVRLEANNRLRWTRELHQFKGNVLFAGGQVEEWTDVALASVAGSQSAGSDLFMPSILPGLNRTASATTGYQNYSSANFGGGAPPPMPTPASSPAYAANNFPGGPGRFNPTTTGQPGPQSLRDVARTNLPGSLSIHTTAGRTAVVEGMDSMTSTFDQRVVKILQRLLIWIYLLVLLVLLMFLAFKSWQRAERKRARREALD